MSGVTLTTTVTYSGTIVSFVVPVTGTYSITAYGAQGGSTQNVLGTAYVPGGLGGEVSGTFALVQGETLDIAVGGQGGSDSTPLGDADFFGSGGGGGGSYVALIDGTTQTLLEAAGGGGGAGGGVAGGPGGLSVGGSGLGGAGNGGGGGAGFYGNGANEQAYAGGVTTAYDDPATGGSDYANGLGGGQGEVYAHLGYSREGLAGGFGGGGGGGAFGGGGGGGGYTGGDTGGGGSSYIDGSAISAQLTAGVATAGEVLIDYPACFLAGTRLATPGGEVAVEALREGDLVITIEGKAQVARSRHNRFPRQ